MYDLYVMLRDARPGVILDFRHSGFASRFDVTLVRSDKVCV